MNKKILNLFLILVLLFIFFLFTSKLKNQNSKKVEDELNKNLQSDYNKSEATLQTAYDFELKNINGGKTKLSDFKDKVVILNFWATWCPPCRAEIPSFIELYKKYHKEGLVIIGIALDNETKVKNFVKDYNINYPVLISDEITPQKYGGIRAIPTTFIIDKNGKIVKQFLGYRDKSVFINEFNNLK